MKKKLRWIWLFVLWVLVHCGYTAVDGLMDYYSTADVAVVLGNKVHEDGTLSERLKSRLDCALHLFVAKQTSTILVSGGLGKEGHWEGTKMQEYLISRGVPDSVIMVDNEGVNTWATAQNAAQIIPDFHSKKVVVVSQYFHLTRCKMFFRKSGFTDVSSAAPGAFHEARDVYSLLREFPAFYLGLLK